MKRFDNYTTDLTIRELRHQTGMTQQAFSDFFGIPKRTVEDWDAGVRKPPAYVIKMIAYITQKERGE